MTRRLRLAWLISEVGIAEPAATQVVEYLQAAKSALGVLPTVDTIVFERFFDETGGTQLVIHAPFGSRINRAWGLALRKRFCRKFDFELQAAATEDCIVLSLARATVSRWRTFPVTCIRRVSARSSYKRCSRRRCSRHAGVGTPQWHSPYRVFAPAINTPQLQRMFAEDLIADVFPDQIACAENLTGEREIPDHPLVEQTIRDCLEEAMDIHGLEQLLGDIESGQVRVVARELTEPSPLALQVLAARPYAYLDDAPLEERRTQAVMARRWQDPRNASDLGKLDASAIARVKDEAFPAAESVDELHDALMWCGLLTSAEITPREQWADLMAELVRTQRAAQVHLPAGQVWAAAERLPRFAAIFPDLTIEPATRVPEPYASENITRENALLEIVRGRMEALGPVTAGALAESLGVDTSEIEQALLALEGEGFAMRGAFTPDFTGVEWCERRLLARIHRYTVDRLRREIEPVTSQDFMRFLCDWHHVTAQSRKDGPDALASIISDLEGFEAPAAAWETEILPARLNEYDFAWLDDLCLAGRAVWARLARPKVAEDDVRRAGPVRTTPIAILARRNVALWTAAAGSSGRAEPSMSSRARKSTRVPRAARRLILRRNHRWCRGARR